MPCAATAHPKAALVWFMLAGGIVPLLVQLMCWELHASPASISECWPDSLMHQEPP